MDDAMTVAGLLLAAGPILGLVPVAHPALLRIWSAPREVYLSTIGAHRRAWYALNAGFAFATLVTAAGLAVLAAGVGVTAPGGPWLVAAAVIYALGGAPWLAFLGVRAARDPQLAGMLADGRPTEPAESIVGAATTGLFGAFALTTAGALVGLAIVLAVFGLVAVPVAFAAGIVAALVLGVQLRTGDCIPAILYLPTLFVGLAILVGWR